MKALGFGLLVAALTLPVKASAATFGLDTAVGETSLKDKGTNLPEILGSITGNFLALIGIIFFGLIIYGGVMWMTSSGNQDRSRKALMTIVYAIFGLLIVLSAYAITTLVFESISQGGGGAPPPADNAECQQQLGSNASCYQIDSCGAIRDADAHLLPPEQLDARRNVCAGDPTKCKLNICPGPADVVCCTLDTEQ